MGDSVMKSPGLYLLAAHDIFNTLKNVNKYFLNQLFAELIRKYLNPCVIL